MGVNLDLTILFKDNNGSAVNPDSLRSQFVLTGRSTGRVDVSSDVETYDTANGIGRVRVPGVMFADHNGYALELYQRTPAVEPADPALPVGLLATGVVVTSRSAYQAGQPFGAVSVPTVVGPAGPAGPAGVRGSIWYSAPGLPIGIDAMMGDMYLDETSGDVYRFENTATGMAWVPA
jgi:hypothetical protein